MNQIILSIYFRFKEMPLILKGVTIIFCVLSISLFYNSLNPFGGMKINGKVVPFFELWTSGIAFLILGGGILLLLISLGIYFKKRWARHLMIILYLTAYILSIIFSLETPDVSTLLSISVLIFIPIWYLYLKNNVREYFNNSKNQSLTSH